MRACGSFWKAIKRIGEALKSLFYVVESLGLDVIVRAADDDFNGSAFWRPGFINGRRRANSKPG